MTAHHPTPSEHPTGFPTPTAALGTTDLIDADNPRIRETATNLATTDDPTTTARTLFEYVRDEIAYDMAPDLSRGRDDWRASSTLERGYGFCQQKATLLAALLRASGIPAGIIIQDILDHKIPEHYVRFLGSQRLEVHGLTCAHLNGRWQRLDATLPAALCQKKGYRIVEFTNAHDAVLPQTDTAGNPHFDVLEEIGIWPDMPEEIVDRTLAFTYLYHPEYTKMARRHGPGM